MNREAMTETETWEQVVITNQGNGTSHCGKCMTVFPDIFAPTCPGCNRTVIDHDVYINMGD